MKITIESTQTLASGDGVPVRIWEGSTDGGVRVHCFIALIAVDSEDDTTEFERELQEHRAVAGRELPLHLSTRGRPS